MKKPHIQIHDSRRRKGEYFIRYVAANGKKLAHSETLSGVANVNKNIRATDSCFSVWPETTFEELNESAHILDLTKSQHWAKKYGCQSGLK